MSSGGRIVVCAGILVGGDSIADICDTDCRRVLVSTRIIVESSSIAHICNANGGRVVVCAGIVAAGRPDEEASKGRKIPQKEFCVLLLLK